jgi:hypothetical protein
MASVLSTIERIGQYIHAFLPIGAEIASILIPHPSADTMHKFTVVVSDTDTIAQILANLGTVPIATPAQPAQPATA